MDINFNRFGVKYNATGLTVLAVILLFPLLLALMLAFSMLFVWLSLLCFLHVFPGFVAVTFTNVFWLALGLLLLPIGKSSNSKTE